MEGADFYAEYRYAPSYSHGDVADSSSARDTRYAFMLMMIVPKGWLCCKRHPSNSTGKGGRIAVTNQLDRETSLVHGLNW